MNNHPSEQDIVFSITSTNIAKGIAVILLLIHHLFYGKADIGPIIFNFSPVYFIALVAKVSVAIFVLLSGYGLSLSFKGESSFAFWRKRFIKFYLNYWLMWLLFVPISIYIFGRDLETAYGDRSLIKTILNIFGLQMFFGYYGYNPTWWFASVLVTLYALFPFLKTLVDKHGWIGVALTVPFLITGFIESGGLIQIDFILPWLFPFALGIHSANQNYFAALKRLWNHFQKERFLRIGLAITANVGLILLILQRQYGSLFYDVRFDGPLAFAIIAMSFVSISSSAIVGRILAFCGQHSFNIFLFHTFIYLYFFPQIFYRNDWSIFATIPLLIACLLISMAIEKLKSWTRFYVLESVLTRISNKKPTKLPQTS